ncbi:hypothetical protein Tco_0586575, partial [Tanacetum coccineum]
MAEQTRLKELATTVERLVESNTQRDNREVAHDNRLQHVETSLETIQQTLDTLTCGIDRLSTSETQQPFNRNTNQNPLQVRHVKPDFPRFDGSDPFNWLFRAEQFFTFYETPDAQRLTIAYVHFEGSVIQWFQMLHKANEIPTWDALANYYHQFTIMANRVEGLSPEALLDCFLSGLKDHIRRDVIAQDPKSLIHAAYVLPISGADIILGAAWLATLGPYIVDYSSATIKFYLDEKFSTLKGYLLHTQDHSIVLQKGVNTIKVRPYCYPVSQKTQIEIMVADMLEEVYENERNLKFIDAFNVKPIGGDIPKSLLQ